MRLPLGSSNSPTTSMNSLWLSLLVLAVGTGLTWWGSGLLEGSSGRLARHYRLPAVVQGTLVVAVGSSFPELTTTVLSALVHGEFELGVSAIVGSAIFNILVIPAIAGLASPPAKHGLRLVYRDAQFYLTSVAVLLLTFSFALIYHPVDGGDGRLSGEMTRTIALVPLFLYGLYLFLQQQDASEYRHRSDSPETDTPEADEEEREEEGEEKGEDGPDIVQVAARGDASQNPSKDWLVLGFSLALIVVGVEGLVRSVLFLGERYDVPSFLWGVTVVAAVTSLPDALVSYRASRRGDAAVSLGNVLGSNIFDLLVAIPAGVLVAGATVIDYSVAAPLMAMLTLATIVLFATMRTDVTLKHWESWLLLALYGAFVAWAVAESVGAVSWVGGA